VDVAAHAVSPIRLWGYVPNHQASAICWRRTVAKTKYQKLTPEDRARHDETQRLVRDRIANHEAKAREQDEAAARRRPA
jgi:hypothetical protein